jgi:hypothetical protein
MANSSSFDKNDSGLYLGGATDDDDASHYTSITLQLQSSAFKQVAYVKSYRSVQAAVPLEVKEAMLEIEFPHVAGKDTKAVASEVGEEKDPREQNYNDCIKTLSVSEVLHLRQAMYTYEKHRLVSTMQQLSTQMYAYHDLLEENQRLKREIIQVKEVKDEKISELENSIIDMKLELASAMSTEDHHRLRISRLEFDIKKVHMTNKESQTDQRRSSTRCVTQLHNFAA